MILKKKHSSENIEEPLLNSKLDIEEPTKEELPEDFDDYDDDLGFDDGLGGGVPPIEKHSDLLKQLTNFDPYLKETVNGWLGLVWDEQSKKYVVDPNKEPIMNSKCAAYCISFLRQYTRDNNIITTIRLKEYIEIMEDVIEVLWLNIGTKADTHFGIKNNGDIMRICNEMEHAIALILMGASDGKYNDMLGTITTRNETVNGMPGQQGGMNVYTSPAPVRKPSMVNRMVGMFK